MSYQSRVGRGRRDVFAKCEVGDVLPVEARRGPFGDPLDAPVWYVLTTPPQREAAARAWLRKIGVADAWYPVAPGWRASRGRRQRVRYERRIVHRVVADIDGLTTRSVGRGSLKAVKILEGEDEDED